MLFSITKKTYQALFYYTSSIFLLFVLFLVYQFLTVPDVAQWKRKNPAETAFMKYRKDDPDYLKKSKIRMYQWISYAGVPDLMKKTIIVAEDASFWIHEGVDWFEITESIKRNIEERSFIRGGSTITQQVARNLYLSPDKNINRKIKEWFIAKKLEKALKKSRILEIYLNISEWGYNIFGIKAASQFYFEKLPDELELHQMVRLAAVLPNPLEMDPRVVNPTVLWRSKVILDRLLLYQFINETEYQGALKTIDSLAEA